MRAKSYARRTGFRTWARMGASVARRFCIYDPKVHGPNGECKDRPGYHEIPMYTRVGDRLVVSQEWIDAPFEEVYLESVFVKR